MFYVFERAVTLKEIYHGKFIIFESLNWGTVYFFFDFSNTNSNLYFLECVTSQRDRGTHIFEVHNLSLAQFEAGLDSKVCSLQRHGFARISMPLTENEDLFSLFFFFFLEIPMTTCWGHYTSSIPKFFRPWTPKYWSKQSRTSSVNKN